MHNPKKAVGLLIVALMIGGLFSLPAVAQDEARKERIVGNLKSKIPQLASLTVSVTALGPSEYGGLDEGTLSIQSPRGNQQLKFLVSKDDKKLYLLNGEPYDVSIDPSVFLAQREKELADAVAGLPVRGNPDAKVTIIEFSDFQCPYCARGADTMEQVLAKYGEDVKLVFKHYPLNFHPWARPAAIAADCAAKQDHEAFWTLHDQYFEHQKEITPENVLAKSKEYLAESGLDLDSWSACAEDSNSEEYKAVAAKVDADLAFGTKMGVSGTPGFFVNGQLLSGAQPLSAFEPLINAAKAGS
jgi:protein-disulfide isomerase